MIKNGFTLVELLIGMLLASLLMLTMLTLFKQTSFISVESRQDAEYETQLEIALLSVQKIVQNAGYGRGEDRDISLNNNRLLWRYAEDAHAVPLIFKCQGFDAEVDSGKNVLRLLKANDCDDVTDLEDLNWIVEHRIASVPIDPNNPTQAIFEFELNDMSCVPFGIEQGSYIANKRLNIKARRKYNYGAGLESKKRSVCLVNFKAP